MLGFLQLQRLLVVERLLCRKLLVSRSELCSEAFNFFSKRRDAHAPM